MTAKSLQGGVVHAMPKDLQTAILGNAKVAELWESITPLARNEWICWVTSGKKEETRGIRIKKAISKMKGGMRRPCCWIGCIHRKDKSLNPSVRYALKRSKA